MSIHFRFGYCGEDAASANDTKRFDAEKAKPSEFGGWGFCSRHCTKRIESQPVLKEAMRRIWSERDCYPSDNDETSMRTQMCVYQLQKIGSVITFK